MSCNTLSTDNADDTDAYAIETVANGSEDHHENEVLLNLIFYHFLDDLFLFNYDLGPETETELRLLVLVRERHH